MMLTLSLILQVIVALTLLTVWLVQSKRPSAYRGGNALTLRDEFKTYGLPDWSFWLVGGLKILSAIGLLLGVVYPGMVLPAALILVLLMIGAIAMHLKVSDPARKSIPAAMLLIFCIVLTGIHI